MSSILIYAKVFRSLNEKASNFFEAGMIVVSDRNDLLLLI